MQKRKGIILAGGSGTRLDPITKSISKQLIPIYNKPMIYYPLSVLMLAGIQDILIITQTNFIPLYKRLLGDGSNFGINIQYESQDLPNGIAESLLIGEKFIGDDKVALILGDNIFYGSSLTGQLLAAGSSDLNSIFCSKVDNRSDFGILEIGEGNKQKIIEKPQKSKSNLAVTGLYFYNNDVVKIAKKLKPSSRGELEITDLNNQLIKSNKINVVNLYRGTLWLDTGTFENLYQCSSIIYSIEKNTNVMVGCIEEIALSKNWITKKQLINSIADKNSQYYLSLLKTIGHQTNLSKISN